MIYQGNLTSDIGTLLRKIKEEKQSSIIAQPPATEPGAPIREAVQEPLKSAESPGSERVVSTRPEAAPSPLMPSQAPVGEARVGAVGIGGPPASIAAAAPYVPPSVSPASVGVSAPSGGGGGGGSAPTSQTQGPNLGTSIGYNAPSQPDYSKYLPDLQAAMQAYRLIPGLSRIGSLQV